MSEPDISAVFRPGGNISQGFGNYEERPQQEIMAASTWKALCEPGHLAVEAGTGVGKSFAYLVPAIYFAKTFTGPVVISTNTLNLQDQLVNKDIPFLEDVLDISFNYQVLKGRSNYICLRRLRYADENPSAIMESSLERDEFELIKRWVNETETGTRDDLPFIPESSIWSSICTESSACRGRKCTYHKNCFYQYARSLLAGADIIVVNHSLYFADLAVSVSSGGKGILPTHEYTIFDEAHTLEEIASSHVGVRITNNQVNYSLRSLYNPAKGTGMLADHGGNESMVLCADAMQASERFFRQVRQQAQEHARNDEQQWELDPGDRVKDTLSESLNRLVEAVREINRDIDQDDVATADLHAEFNLRQDRLLGMVGGLQAFTEAEPDPRFVTWVEFDTGVRQKTISLNRIPLDVSGFLETNLFKARQSVIMTGATLAVGQESDFDYFSHKIGLGDYTGLKLDSPFDFKNRVSLHMARDIPAPTDQRFREEAGERLRDFIPQCEGGVLLLFTSYRSMNNLAEDLYPVLTEMGRTVFVQGQGRNRSMLLKDFQEAGDGILFATSSFWMGVDVPGSALSNVFIMRLPFAVPNHPVIRGKCRLIQERGGNAFMEYSLPEAVLTFKQGIGRLLRHREDRGRIYVFDSRITRARYGKYFQLAVPECRTEYF